MITAILIKPWYW